MIYDIRDETLVHEIKNLVNEIENTKENFNVYCELMKQLFLSGSEKN